LNGCSKDVTTLKFDANSEKMKEPGIQTTESKTPIEIESFEDEIPPPEEIFSEDEEENSTAEEILSVPLVTPSINEIQKVHEDIDLNPSHSFYSIPITVNSTVVSYLKAFQSKRHKNIQNALNRSVEYIDDFKQIFREYGVPEDMAYLPIIESGFRTHALSRMRAVGIWQFIGSTARLFGLRVDWMVDERRDPYKATVAAAKYLKHLHELYGDWYIALACYNGGTRRVDKAIKHLDTTDFFKIANSRMIRRETRGYVPAFLASLIIAKNPGLYDFKIEGEKKIFSDTKTVKIISPVNLADVAQLAGIPPEDLKTINPELTREFTPFDQKEYSIRVPNSIDESVFSQLKPIPPEKKYTVGWYKVRNGDSLYSIARRFNTSVKEIKKANNIRSNLIRPGLRLIIPRGL